MDGLVKPPDWPARSDSVRRRDPLRVVDVRWYLDPTRSGRDAYLAGHIPGAVFLTSTKTSRRRAAGGACRRAATPGPPRSRSGAFWGRGITPGDPSWPMTTSREPWPRGSGTCCGRTATTRGRARRRHREMDRRGTTARDRGCRGPPRGLPGSPSPRLRPSQRPSDRPARGSLVLDARAAERYRGEVEPIDPRAGHIPGAVNAPFTANLTARAVPVFRPSSSCARVTRAWARTGRPVVYCGSGVTACHDLLALHLAGLSGRLYAGSWSEWSSDPSLPAALGGE